MFPAGSFYLKDGKLMVVGRSVKVIRKAQVPVVPIYFHAKKVGYFIYFLK
jgi:hypothetical protein